MNVAIEEEVSGCAFCGYPAPLKSYKLFYRGEKGNINILLCALCACIPSIYRTLGIGNNEKFQEVKSLIYIGNTLIDVLEKREVAQQLFETRKTILPLKD